MTDYRQTVGERLRDWRQRRGYSQLSLALEAEISQRHLSFVESGRSQPSRDMILRLAEQLRIPLRDRNALLLAGGYAPAFPERALAAPELEAAWAIIDRILSGHNPHPALAVDRHWTLLSANRAVGVLLQGIAPHLLEGPVNVLRLSLQPEGLAPRILNYKAWRNHILARLSHDIEVSADPFLVTLFDEIRSYPVPPQALGDTSPSVQAPAIAIPLILTSPEGPLEFLSTTTVFGTAVDVTLSDLVIESFFPANAQTTAAMSRLYEALPSDA